MNTISESERQALYFLIHTGLFSNNTIRKLRKVFGSYEAVYSADENAIAGHINPKYLNDYISAKRNTDIVYEYSRLAKKGVHFSLFEDADYPVRFRQLNDSPVAILYKGFLPSSSIPSVAVIGARNCSNYGRSLAEEYTSYIAEAGIQIISGMAMGVDGFAGQAALDCNGKSFAVLGSGPDICYPSSNRKLYEQLTERGGIISEYPLGSPGVGWHFPMRNRLISVLSDVLIVIEAKEKSGTMITVDCALEQGRDVFALPGRPCDPVSRGCNLLIRQGAGILISPEEFMEDFLSLISGRSEYAGFLNDQKRKAKQSLLSFASPEEELIYACLDYSPKSLNEICSLVNKKAAMSLSDITVCLCSLSISGAVINIGGNYARK